MIAPRPHVLAVVLIAGGVFAGCTDDGNDAAYQVRRATDLAADRRATVAESEAESEPTAEPIPTNEGDPDEGSVTSEAPVDTMPAVEPTGVVVPVIALDNTFRPEIVEISVGDEVFWENRGLNEHDVLYVEGDDWGIEVEEFQPGDVYSHVFTEPGEYRYYCSIHGSTEVGMVGTVVVTG